MKFLADFMPELKKRGLNEKIEVYIDDGVRRGSDIFKAVAWGAKGIVLAESFYTQIPDVVRTGSAV